MPTIGILVAGDPDPTLFLKVPRVSLRGLGYSDGQNVRLEIRSARAKPEQLSELAALTLRHRVADVHQSRAFVSAGGLLVTVGRILKGEKPGELPVVQVTTVELTLNLKIAKAPAVNIPLSILGRADEVIE
jgi:hypothetical protein